MLCKQNFCSLHNKFLGWKKLYKKNSIINSLSSFNSFWHATFGKVTYSTSSTGETVVIVGTGWGGYSFLKNIDRKKYNVVVVSPRNHFLFTPLLVSTTVGTLEFRSIIEPVRNIKFNQLNEGLHLARALTLDVTKQTLLCESVIRPDLKYEVSYDKLVIAVGCLSNTFGIPGVEKHAFFLKEVGDARKIRNTLLGNLELGLEPGISKEERKRLLHTVVVGGGPTGVEFGAELYDFIRQDVSRLFRQELNDASVTLVESQQILSSFDGKLRSYAEKKIRERERFQLLQSTVTEVREDSVVFDNGQVVPCGLVVWSTGLAPHSFVRDLSLPKNKRGQILTNRHLAVLNAPDHTVFAIGDCADIEDVPLPCTAQVAERQGRYLASVFNRQKDLSSAKPFEFINQGMLAYIGGYEGLADLPEVKLRGFPSWFLWRSAYLTRLGSWRLRMQVPMDWLKTFIYGRDVSRF